MKTHGFSPYFSTNPDITLLVISIYIYPIRCVSPIKSPLYHHWLGFFISQFVHVHLGFKSLVYQRFLRYSQNVSRWWIFPFLIPMILPPWLGILDYSHGFPPLFPVTTSHSYFLWRFTRLNGLMESSKMYRRIAPVDVDLFEEKKEYGMGNGDIAMIWRCWTILWDYEHH